MHDEHPHHLLAQVPLTVSPFLSLPTQTTLPYHYKQLPSTLPPSVIDPPSSTSTTSGVSTPTTIPNPSDPTAPTPGVQQQGPKPAYVTSASGHSAHPEDIIASCRALQAHLLKMQEEARETVRKWEEGIRERELAEKRRVAPGWLDEEVRMLVPEKKGNGSAGAGDVLMMEDAQGAVAGPVLKDPEQERREREGEELDRAFGGMGIS